MADTDPLEYTVRSHPDLDITRHGLTLWDLDREFPVGGFAGERLMKLRDILGVLRDAYCRRVGVEYMHITDPQQRRWIQERIELKHAQPDRAAHNCTSWGGSTSPRHSRPSCRPSTSGRSGSASKAPRPSSRCWTPSSRRRPIRALDEAVVGMPHRGRLNVLANIVGKPYAKIFNEFEGQHGPEHRSGLGRCEIPPRRARQVPGPERQGHRRAAHREPVRTSRPSTRCSRGHRPGQAGRASTRARPASPCYP